MIQFLAWGGFIYAMVAKAIMILRVAVMFNDAKRMTYILSLLYSLVAIEAFIVAFLWIGPHSGLIVSTVTLVDDAVCSIQLGRSVMFPVYGGIPGGLFDLLILALSLYRFAVHVIETRKMLGRTKVNVYMRLLFEHSVLYFVLNTVAKGLADGMSFSSSTLYLVLAGLYCSTVPYVLFPRLVLGFKGHRWKSSELYVGSDPLQPSHSHSHSDSPSTWSDGPRGEEYGLMDVIPPRVDTQNSKKEGPEVVHAVTDD
ncbi:hypothetical protein PAXRUDRAFT_658917 [Paxillus rubicundulus Ve08.2h10]|uniref:Unplaced genomic scaffold scaffold_634, whole genome shotgun sequence n=1 Tax=Paxillus rubicundulus Ve08.2h10 TaxID=930991 RepID=A0A0D0DIN5_9AGAM|nr:hypothetical protein PAXRUDRAFT_658917 [Paxillus rubicundulus Ve08.2h10]